MRRMLAAGIVTLVLVVACGPTEHPSPVVQHVSMKLTDSSTAFGVALLDHLLAEQGAGNVFISPLSATIALSMAASAAHGDTRAAMMRVLGLDPNTDPADQARQTIERLVASDPNAQLELAQAVWAEQGLELSPTYLAKLRNDYKAQLANLDFSSPDAPATVNRWVDNATHHKIQQLVSSFDPGTVAYLVNATYFHALWAAEFKAMPGTLAFHTFSGADSQVAMMQRQESVTELRTPDYIAELLPYKGGRFSAVLLLPAGTLTPSEFSTVFTTATWNQALGYLHHSVGSSLGGKCTHWSQAQEAIVTCDATLQMPKFKLDYFKDLTATLRAMGMPVPGAGMPEICAACFISSVVQKTHLEVDEKGTTAAAATGVAVATALRLPTVVDRPFGFALIDNATDAPLFLGAIGQI